MTEKKWLAHRCLQCGKPVSEENGVIIAEDKGWVFDNEDCLQKHFHKEIDSLAKELETRRTPEDIPLETIDEYADILDSLLDEPAEIWEDTETFPQITIHHFIGEFSDEKQSLYYVATVYLTGETPSFVFVHFPTTDAKLVDEFRRGRLVFDRENAEIAVEASEDDALSEGDELAQGLYNAMLRLRTPTDIPESEFPEYTKHRQETIEDGDEMWRSTDMQGNTLVTFIREFSGEQDVSYVVVTVEDVVSSSHFILFSFPTRDPGLLDRYRQGQNLHENPLNRTESH